MCISHKTDLTGEERRACLSAGFVAAQHPFPPTVGVDFNCLEANEKDAAEPDRTAA